MIHLAFGNINILFALSFKNSNNDPTRNSLDKYYVPLVKGFNALIDNKPFSDQPVKKKHTKNFLKCKEIMIIQQEIY